MFWFHHNKHIGYNLNVMPQSACLVIIPITVDNFVALFNCTPVDRASDSMMAPALSSTDDLRLLKISMMLLAVQGSPTVTQHVVSDESSSY